MLPRLSAPDTLLQNAPHGHAPGRPHGHEYFSPYDRAHNYALHGLPFPYEGGGGAAFFPHEYPARAPTARAAFYQQDGRSVESFHSAGTKRERAQRACASSPPPPPPMPMRTSLIVVAAPTPA